MDTTTTAKAFFTAFNGLENDIQAEQEGLLAELRGQLKGAAWAAYKVGQGFLRAVEGGIALDSKYGKRMTEAIELAKAHIAAIETVQAEIARLETAFPKLVAEEAPKKTAAQARFEAQGAAVLDRQSPKPPKKGKGHGEKDFTGNPDGLKAALGLPVSEIRQ